MRSSFLARLSLALGGLCLGVASLNAQPLSAAKMRSFARGAKFRIGIVSNLTTDGKGLRGVIILQNLSSVALPPGVGNWSIYLHMSRKILSKRSAGLALSNVSGDLRRLTPLPSFSGLSAGKTIQIPFRAEAWIASYTDFMPRAFIALSSGKAANFKNTDTEHLQSFVLPITKREQILRYGSDAVSIPTPQSRMRSLPPTSAYPSKDEALRRIIPKPVSAIYSIYNITIGRSWAIYYGPSEAKTTASLLQGRLMKLYGIYLLVWHKNCPKNKGKVICFETNPNLKEHPEGYVINAGLAGIHIQSSTAAGLFYGSQTLLNLLPSHGPLTIPAVKIKDYPRLSWRALSFDDARNFHGIQFLHSLIDAMASYKLSILQWHFSDNEGWRLEIPGLPELTKVGARRCYNPAQKKCLLTQLGTGALSRGSGGGFVTRQQFISLLRYASARHVQILPEIEGPSHDQAAQVAMQARYRKEIKSGHLQKAQEYLLSDPTAPGTSISARGVISPCLDSTYHFFDKVVSSLSEMYAQAGLTLTAVHIGGDEVEKNAWQTSASCSALKAKHPELATTKALERYYTKKIIAYLTAHNIQTVSWEEATLATKSGAPIAPDKLSPKKPYFVEAWNNIWERGGAENSYKLANAGYKVILSPVTNLYFDQPQAPVPGERGYYWAARYTDTRKVFLFNPSRFYANAQTKVSGAPIRNLTQLLGHVPEPLKAVNNIVGIEGAFFSETARTPEQASKMLFPRIIALAERAWHKAAWEQSRDRPQAEAQWPLFSSTLAVKELPRLERLHIAFHLPQPGAQLTDSTLTMRSAYPYLPMQYSLDNGATWERYYLPVNLSSKQESKTILVRSFLGVEHSLTSALSLGS